jgi:uncharacterized protein (DUF2252 family)
MRAARLFAARLLGCQVVIRELMPQDLKLEIDRLCRAEAVMVARFLAAVVGRAHGRQMDDIVRRHWRDEIIRKGSFEIRRTFMAVVGRR